MTRKISQAIANILAGKQKFIYLGNLDAKRDWGYAPEYVEVMWRILQYNTPDDFVIGMGEAHSVREFVECAFAYVGLDFEDYIKIDRRYFRPTEVESLVADSKKARRTLGWMPKIEFKDLVKIMVDADMKKVGLEPVGEGYAILKKMFPKRWWNVD